MVRWLPALLVVLALSPLGCGGPPSAGRVLAAVPAEPDPEARYVLYLHGRIIEEQGERPTHPDFGTYKYRDILQVLADSGFVVVSEPRPAGTDVAAYAGRVAGQVQELLAAGVPADHVTVVGFSKGGGIAIHAASQLGEPDVRFAFLAACGDGVFDPAVRVSGRILSVIEATDDLAAPSCGPLFAHARDVRQRAEVTIATGERHGAFYRPRPEWLAPCDAIADVVETYGVRTAGVARIEGGAVAWTCYAGEERPGVPTTAATRFSAASITKTVTAEAVLRLVADGRLSLDEPMAAHWIDPDVADDPRHALLTPRHALTRTTGFPNWRFFLESGRLEFLRDPGTDYGYSGEGFVYLAQLLEATSGRGFHDLVQEIVFDPIGMESATVAPYASDTSHFAQAFDEDGQAYAPWCRPGEWCTPEDWLSAAHGLRVTVEDLAAFLVSVAERDGYGAALAADRDRVHTPVAGDDAAVECGTDVRCPEAQGYGLGWRVLDWGDDRLLFHGGSDWSEVTVAAISPVTGDGFVVLLNAPNVRALRAMPEVLALVAPGSPLVAHYERWRQRAEG